MRKAIYLLFALSALLAATTASEGSSDSSLYYDYQSSDANGTFNTLINRIDNNEVATDSEFPDVITFTPYARKSNKRVEELSRRPGAENNNPSWNSKGIGKDEKTPPLCKCRRLRRNKNALCYDMEVPLQPYGRCTKRKCGAQYECVFGGGRRLKNCIRRIATHEVKLRHYERGTLLCNTYVLKEKRVFYELYT